MASTVTAETASNALSRLVSGKTIHCVLLTGTSTNWNIAATAADFQFASSITADEATDASYSRAAVTGAAATADTANDRGELDCNDVTFTSLSGSNVVGVAFIEIVTNDTDSPILSLHDMTASPVTPTGSDFIVRIGAEGFLHATVV